MALFEENLNVEELFNLNHFESILNDLDWNSLFYLLSPIPDLLVVSDNRKNLSLESVKSLAKVLNAAASLSMKENNGSGSTVAESFSSVTERFSSNTECLPSVTECFRSLRNSCVGGSNIQIYIAESTTAIDDTKIILQKLCLLPTSQPYVACIQVAIQFLGNLIVNNYNNQVLVWDKCSSLLINLLKYNDEKIGNYSAMVVYNALLGRPDLSHDVEEHGTQLLAALIDRAMSDSEFALYIIELLLKKEHYLYRVYPNIEPQYKLFLLEAAHSLISAEHGDRRLPPSCITFLAEQFKACSDSILQTRTDFVECLQPTEVAKLLELLASASGDSPYLQELQKDTSLLINCAFLLRNMHSVGKENDNYFTSIQKLADLSLQVSPCKVQNHPAYGFKAGLVRLLGNLCWKHTPNQDQVRELGCIPLLLDCCNIDARNPLMIQWVVLAMRNLCEGNLANQAVITAMTREGTVDTSLLNEMGLTLHQDDTNKIVITPYQRP